MTVSEGGWGWVVVFCSFYHHAFVGAAAYSLSVFYSSWVEDLDSSRGLASWVLTLAMSCSMGSGPLNASLSARFGNRAVVMAGSIISAIGIFISCFATSIYALIVLIGFWTGLGLGMQYLPNLAMIPFYFDKKRSLAIGVAVCGFGVGMFMYPPFLIWLEEQYTWRGAMMIVSGIALNMAVCGALLRPLDSRETGEERRAMPTFEGDEEDEGGEEEATALYANSAASNINTDTLERKVGTTSNLDHEEKKPLNVSVMQNGGCAHRLDLHVNESNSNHTGDRNQGKDAVETSASCGEITCKDSVSPKTRHLNTNVDMDHLNDQEANSSTCKVSLCTSTNSVSSGKLHPQMALSSGQLNGFPKISNPLRPHQNKAISASLRHLGSSRYSNDIQQHKFSSAYELHNKPRSIKNSTHNSNSAHFHHAFPGIGSHIPNKRSHVDILLSSSIFDLEKADRRRNESIMHLHRPDSEVADPLLPLNCNGSTHTSHLEIPQNVLSADRLTLNGKAFPNDAVLQSSLSVTDCPKKRSCCPVSSSHFTENLYIMKNPYFATFALCNFLTCITYLTPVVYFVDRAVDNGVEKSQAALAFSMYGAGNLLGRIALGWVADYFRDSLVLGALGLIGCGIATCLSPLCGAYVVLHGLYGLVFGTLIGGFVTLTPLILVDLLGLAMVSRSLGLILVFQALGFITGTPVAGWMFDAIGSYTVSFILHGAVVCISGLVLLALKVAVIRSRRHAAAAAAAVTAAGVQDEDKNCAMNDGCVKDNVENCSGKMNVGEIDQNGCTVNGHIEPHVNTHSGVPTTLHQNGT
ncbi:monocarboxylate transporter 12 [Plakobranchus ocellatus]|uniref:Monocarboxylate transporter 12 n=1 Tax=Plakobranchus ocellatus TaxID=259542 RepID=A0AAV4CI17_9GAST|nr:monocarboxylate transporter 12 [Plakobranchus ocellatus]